MIRLARSFCLSLLALAVPLCAQDTVVAHPGPAPEVEKLKSMLGHWEGSGTAMTGPGETSKWTCKSTYALVLGDHFVQEDTHVVFEGGHPPLYFRAYMGWCKETSRYLHLSVSNFGEGALGEMEWLPDGTIVQVIRKKHEGITMAERVRTKIDGNTMTFAMDMLMPEGTSQEAVKGTMKRVAKGQPAAVEAGAAMGPPAQEMARIARTAGTYTFEGEMIMMPGAPVMKLTGTDVIRPIFGGTVLHGHTEGKAEGMPGAYEADGFYTWNPDKSCFEHLFVSNMGEIGAMEARFGPKQESLIITGATLYQGEPSAFRGILELNADGTMKRTSCHCLIGTAAPFENFKGTYKRK